MLKQNIYLGLASGCLFVILFISNIKKKFDDNKQWSDLCPKPLNWVCATQHNLGCFVCLRVFQFLFVLKKDVLNIITIYICISVVKFCSFTGFQWYSQTCADDHLNLSNLYKTSTISRWSLYTGLTVIHKCRSLNFM